MYRTDTQRYTSKCWSSQTFPNLFLSTLCLQYYFPSHILGYSPIIFNLWILFCPVICINPYRENRLKSKTIWSTFKKLHWIHGYMFFNFSRQIMIRCNVSFPKTLVIKFYEVFRVCRIPGWNTGAKEVPKW